MSNYAATTNRAPRVWHVETRHGFAYAANQYGGFIRLGTPYEAEQFIDREIERHPGDRRLQAKHAAPVETAAPCGHPLCEPFGGQCLTDGHTRAPRVVESVNEGQLPGQTRIGGEDVQAQITEDFMLTQTAPAPKAEPLPVHTGPSLFDA